MAKQAQDASGRAGEVEDQVIDVLRRAGLDVGRLWYYGSDDEVVMHITVSIPMPEGDELIKVEECSDCGRLCPPGTSSFIKDLEQRIGAGETVPAGECIECGALTHLVRLRRSVVVARSLEG